MNRLVRLCLASVMVLSLFFASAPAWSEEKEKANPKVGLVLSGGGALGLAHVGVLKVMEQERVPVHFISGTSMGSIVGAAYAAGLSVEEMEKEFLAVDWDDLFNENVPREEIPYRLKSGRDRRIVGDAKIGLGEGTTLAPIAFVQGQKLLPLFQRIFVRVKSPIAFDELPVPFRAVAADIENGEEVVIESGDLATAARASMAVPGFFAPVEVHGRVLVDGGIVNNLPIDLGLKAGCDVLIVIDLPEKPKTREELKTLGAVSGQVLGFMLDQNVQRSKKLLRPQDIYVTPELEGFSATSFNAVAELIARGEKAGQQVIERLRVLGLPKEDYEEYESKRREERPAEFTVEFVQIVNKTS